MGKVSGVLRKGSVAFFGLKSPALQSRESSHLNLCPFCLRCARLVVPVPTEARH